MKTIRKFTPMLVLETVTDVARGLLTRWGYQQYDENGYPDTLSAPRGLP